MSGEEAPIIGKDALGRPVKDLSVIPWWGVDRKKIEWYPKINYDRCAGCGLCFVTCGRRVFDWDREKGKTSGCKALQLYGGMQHLRHALSL